MSKYSDIVALLEWMDTKKKPDSSSSRPKTTPNVVDLLQKKRRELEELETYLKDLEKIKKKEDKKTSPWDKVSTPQLAMILIIVMPIYMALVQKMIH